MSATSGEKHVARVRQAPLDAVAVSDTRTACRILVGERDNRSAPHFAKRTKVLVFSDLTRSNERDANVTTSPHCPRFPHSTSGTAIHDLTLRCPRNRDARFPANSSSDVARLASRWCAGVNSPA